MRRLIATVATLALLAGAAAAAQEFLAEVGDVPLMDGLKAADEGGMVFDSPGGRIAEGYASGAVDRDAVLAFYRTTLPQLGWRPTGKASFGREGEMLNIDFLGRDGDLTVRFRLSPGQADTTHR